MFETLNTKLSAEPRGHKVDCDSAVIFQHNQTETSQKCCGEGES